MPACQYLASSPRLSDQLFTTRTNLYEDAAMDAAERKVALRLAVVRGYKYKIIRKFTGICERTTQRGQALHPCTGDVSTS
jgi:hypothetical protein